MIYIFINFNTFLLKHFNYNTNYTINTIINYYYIKKNKSLSLFNKQTYVNYNNKLKYKFFLYKNLNISSVSKKKITKFLNFY